MKYIMFETAEGGKYPVIFPEAIVHADMAKLIRRIMPQPVAPISAGFVSVGLDVQTHGESETLKLKSKASDAAYIVCGQAAAYMPDAIAEDILNKMKARAK